MPIRIYIPKDRPEPPHQASSRWIGLDRDQFKRYTDELAHRPDEPTIKLSASLDEHASRQPTRKDRP